MSDPMLPWQGKVTAFELDQAKGTWTLSFDLDEPSSRQFEEGLSKPSAEAASGRLTDAYGNRFFAVGDLVTRDGTDVHRVVSHNGSDGHAPDGMTVVCVKAPASGWTEVGEEEFNVCRRYEWVEPVECPAPGRDADLPAVGSLA
ncbi:hypothetical protein MKK58_17620 [Methylobacterium sp. J-078]|uniref:hypothetical protein n=1 Tax=Methylobacterium sp. J-078 TaxID=2836657 RepID=UPI001FBAABB4|nr:hypothetical protein [Methylobacterium sp. J-078]MCJ2046337.1 hypothetical protein [Methylobacterium sp. J-078]